ncbi:type I iterative polyketide synthase [Aspergillus viridinutans]|uniref:Type I iterative polyketide synthase n=1 Tax=Aspergillus viridinutans TaxID=75553 RepID=A0A9P3F066_ASPVI|nr:type I iterative polyketide synthase [Aspergillus viridinutans]GIJ99998.1 type I iterative polyketide synthase [Aspergillus viridinutans]
MSIPIAVCGMALRLPGGISNPSQFWDFLVSKKDARSRVPDSRYAVSSYYSKTGANGTIKTEHGYFLDETVDLGALDASFFSFTKAELELVDPQQRLLLEVARECLESAGEADYRGKDIGCFVGSFGDDWIQNLFHDPQMYAKYPLLAGGDYAIPNRISYEYDLRGPSMMIRTACSSTMVCLHEACLAIQRGECSAAVVGGCNLIMAPTMTAVMTAKGVLSPDGTSKTFDAEANGYGRGEAINAIYIKPLQDALRDGNPIRAVIRGTATNSDGKSSGLNVPSQITQESVIRKAYAVAGIDDISDTAFVECHGTGTAVGDPIEVIAVANTFGDRGIYIGSVKPNVGHSEGASGLTSIIKAVLAIENEVIPPNINFNTPNPKIPFEEKNIKVPTKPTPWPQDQCIRVSVNSFGMGGVNAHAVLESAKSFTLPRSPPTGQNAKLMSLLLFSANTMDSLQRRVDEHHKYLQDQPGALADMAYTLGTRREHLPFRAASIVRHDLSLTTTPMAKIPLSPPKLVFVFTGQGAQWSGMGVALYKSNRIFQRSIQGLEEILRTLPDAPAWSIIDEMMKPVEKSNLHRASYAQPICTALQIGLVDTLSKLKVGPSAVIGHSSGELAAAYAAGKLTAREAFIAAFYRGVVSEYVAKPGGMVAVAMGREETSAFLMPGVIIACENSPSSVTISGDVNELAKVTQAINTSRPDVLVRQLRVDVAYHSPYMNDVGETYRSHMARFLVDSRTGRSPQVEFFSTVTGKRLEEATLLDPEYWQSNLGSPVLFRTAIQSLASHHKCSLLFLEIGPHSTLSGPIRQTLDQVSLSHPYVSCLIREKNCEESFLLAMAELYSQHIPLALEPLTNPDGNARVLTDLPTYPWQHTYSNLFMPRKNADWLFLKHPKHELLGIRVSESTDNDPSWRNLLPLEEVPWLREHKVRDNVVFPAAGFLCMAGEAVRQLNPQRSDGFRVRDMEIGTALLLNDVKSIDTVTTLRKVRASDWFDFTISSHNGVCWVEHCSGQVLGASHRPGIEAKVEERLPRRIQTRAWYKALEQAGYGYGSAFQGMYNPSSSATEHIAAGYIISTLEESTYYPVHPTKLDAFFQIVYLAVQKGRVWGLDQLLVPTHFAEIEIYTCSSDLNARAWGGGLPNGAAWGSGQALDSDGAVSVRLREARMSPLRTEQDAKDRPDFGNALRLHWRPDIQFANLTDLVSSPSDWKEHMKLLSKLTTLCIAQARSRLESVQSEIPHLKKYQAWLQNQPLLTTDFDMESVVAQILATPASPCAIAMMKVLENIVAMCKGELEPLEVLMGNEILFNLYNYLNEGDRSALFQLLGHRHPKQRILEIGAGTGSSTTKILPETRYSTYTFTDVSAAFFPAAKERLKDYPSLVFKTLDISQDPLDQGFEPQSFDLIVAANVLHATPSLNETLVNVRRLLHPQGVLLLEELCPETKFPNFITGVLPGWWAGEADGRVNEPYVRPERWEFELKKAGFRGLDDVGFDAAPPFHKNAFMLASPLPEEVRTQRHVVLLSNATSTEIAIQMQRQLRLRGYEVAIQGLRDPLPDGRDVIAVVDTVTPFFHELDASRLSDFQLFMCEVQQSHSGVFWVTRCSQLNCQDPRFSLTIGVARTARSEFGIDFTTCEFDEIKYTSLALTIDVFEKYHARTRHNHTLSEQEFVICRDTVHVGRMLPTSISEELASPRRMELKNHDRVLTLAVGSYGVLDSLRWAVSVDQPVMQDNEVEIEVDSAGVNFKDVLMALDIVHSKDSRLGLEAAGVVRKVGSEVTNCSPGDRVFVIGPGCFATTIVVAAARCTKIPDSLSIQDAATMPLVFSTVIHCLVDIGQLDKSQTVLIHSASGGVGLAAMQICQMLGATIYATVSSKEKGDYLIKTYGIPENHIFSSRDSSFLSEAMNATHGRGVDIVLNTLSGELFHASCECVTECGKLIDLAKGNSQLSGKHFRSNATYTVVDLTDYIRLKPGECQRLLKTIVDLYSRGHIQPIRPVRTFAADEIAGCFRYMQSGQHIGKLRISLHDQGRTLRPLLPPKTATFCTDAAYLLVGGLRGLGSGLARWMAEHNARNFIFLSRNAGNNPSDKELLDELESQGCSVTIIKGNVCNIADVEKAISSAPVPLKGIFNLSMVLQDESLLRISIDDWNAAIEPKVQGTWNLHKASLNHDIDYFMLFGSMCGILGMPGQANYAAANTFLDSFVQYRHQLGLPASVVDLGAVDGIGYIADNPQVLERSKWLKHVLISQKELFNMVTAAMCQSNPPSDTFKHSYTNPAQIVTGFRDNTNTVDPFTSNAFFFDARLATYLNTTANEATIDQSTGQNQLSNFVSAAGTDPSTLSDPSARDFIARQIAKYVFDLLMKPVEDVAEIDLSRSLSDVGLDSLAAVEVRSWWKSTIGIEISVLEIMSLASFDALGEHALEGLKRKFAMRE